jgi:hypothetical protein
MSYNASVEKHSMRRRVHHVRFKIDSFEKKFEEVEDGGCINLYTQCDGIEYRFQADDSRFDGFDGTVPFLFDYDVYEDIGDFYELDVECVMGTPRCFQVLESEQLEGVTSVKFEFPSKAVLCSLLDNDGALSITFIVVHEVPREKCGSWSPKFVQEEFLISTYKSSTSALKDIKFIVGGKHFSAHKIVLEQRCKQLYSLVENSEGEPVIIEDINTDVFEMLLKYIYTVKKPTFSDTDQTKKILEAADRVGIIGLKLLAELELSSGMYFHKNVCEFLLLADAHSCALLKDCAMDYIVNHYETVKKSEDWKMVEQSNNLGMELFKFQNSRKCMRRGQ